MKTKFVIADNNPIRRDGIRAILEQENFEVTYTQSCLESLEEHLGAADIVIWGADAQSPINSNVIRTLRDIAPDIKVMVLDSDNGLSPAIKAIGAGANGYITQGAQREEFLFGINYVLKGKNYIDPTLTIRLFNKLTDFEDHLTTLNTNFELSDRENEILDLMVCGYANKEIAYKLFTTKRNIENLRQNLIVKTGAKDNLSLILYRLHKEFIRD
ncbi:LuxR C-terminal-related transcriptional regulator [Olivibacter domesticus]|uniref:Two component transcriptional regulator, LuxR family n=1 Tax=Olivibacter domesticus TaxID=407022 RepID=A0A1H7KFV4_OLID1|nr:response regulator transcription factor [Olivibacter domesticus]SEK85688.1 two component transcriptional regulator, LuxR family [Olivibacter domesticus]